MRKYSVHKIFGPTVQGEGGMTGTVCHLIRFSGCNMWDGRPETRRSSGCPFCDTDFFAHTLMTAPQIAAQVDLLGKVEWITISGGEPALQLDQELVNYLHEAGYLVAVETNGTRPLKARVDYLTLSPKLPEPLTVIRECDCLKLLWPHPNPLIIPESFGDIQAGSRYLQPVDTGNPNTTEDNIRSVVEKLYTLPGWKLSLQIHNFLGVE
ncbi:MAG: radical SAM protein [Dehalococcoidia bacterium]